MPDHSGTCSWSTWRYRSEFVGARTLSHRHVSCGAVVRCTQGFVSLSFVGSVHAVAWVIKLTDMSKTRVPRLVAVERGRTLFTI